MLMSEYNLRFHKNWDPVSLYASEFLEHLGHIFGLDFGYANAIDKAADQYVAYLEFVNERDQRGY